MGVSGLTTFLREGRNSLSTVHRQVGKIEDPLVSGHYYSSADSPPLESEWIPLVVDAWA